MKVRSIPAQITTVEDKIVGNLNISQILLLMIPVFWGMIVYTLFSPVMDFALYKVVIFVLVCLPSVIFAIRIKDKIVFQWLIILLRYNLRPKFYLFNKNDAHLRDLDIITIEKAKRKTVKAHAKKIQHQSHGQVSFSDLIKLEGILANPKYSFSIKTQKKGALYVAVEQKQK